VAFLLTAGIETTEKVLTSTFTWLALNREEWDAIRARRDDRNALSAFSAEALRMFPPVNGLTRNPLEPVEIRGVEIAAGETLALLLVSANRDEDHFVDTHRFDRDRFINRADAQFTPTSDILPFGAGTHHCTGSRLAQTEMIHAFQKLFERVGWMEPAGELPPEEGFMLHGPPSLPVVLHA
jgi:pulcherriminic acid synthase